MPVPVTCLDGGILATAVIGWWFQEYFLHKYILHSSFDWYGKDIHQEHHEKPYHHVSIDPAWLMLVWMSTVGLFLGLVLPLPYALTATTGYASAGLGYEWLHFIAHTRVRFRRGSYAQRVQEHHCRHHMLDSGAWLAFSLLSLDSLFGTATRREKPSA